MSLSKEQQNIRVTEIALLGAFALFLSTIEMVIPRPLPYMRIGLANLSVMLGLAMLSTREYFLLVLLKILGQGIIHGTLFSYVFLFSLGGSSVSALGMLLLYRCLGRQLSFIGISVSGAFLSNLMQITLARLILFGRSAWLIAPPFLAVGLVTSVILGLFAQQFSIRSRWLAAKTGGAG